MRLSTYFPIGHRLRLALAAVTASTCLVVVTSGVAPELAGATTTSFTLGTIAANSGYANLTTDASGNIWIADPENHQVSEVAPDGTVLERWGTFGSAPQDLYSPTEVIELASGNVVIPDSFNGGIKEFTASGTYIGSFGDSQMTGPITLGDDGDIYAETQTGIGQYDQNGNLLTSWTYASLGASPQNGSGWAPTIAEQGGVISFLDGYGNLYQLTTSGSLIGHEAVGLASISPDGQGGFYGKDSNLTAGDVLHLSSTGVQSSFAPTPYANILGVTYTSGYVDVLTGGSSGATLHKYDLAVPVVTVAKTSGTNASQTATFSAAGSYLPFGSITDYRWDLDGSGNFATDTGTSPTVSETLPAASAGSVSVRVTGSSGQTATATTTFSISPSASVITNPGTQLTGSPVTLSAAGYGSVGGTPTDYQWDFDGSKTYSTDTGASSSVTHTFTSAGSATVDVRVTRPGGDVDTASVTFAIDLAPPAGAVGVSIDNGDYATDSTAVTLSPIWPALSTSMTVSNDGGFGAAGNTTQEALTSSVPWTLQSAGGGKVTRIVYVRFGSTTTFSDDIVLDETSPTISDATITSGPVAQTTTETPQVAADAHVKKKVKTTTWKVKVAAKEGISGVSAIALSPRKSGGTVITLRRPTLRGVLNLKTTEKYVGTTTPKYVRARSAAGKWSKWVLITS